MNKFLEKVTNGAPYLIVGVTLFVTIAALISLILSDIITGQVTGAHISTNKWFGLFVSFATTGMLVACGALLFKFWNDGNYIGFGITLLVFIGLQGADIYFDAVSVDIMRFGKIVFSSEMTDKPEAMAHNIYRFLVGGISLVGEPLAVGSLVMFPVLKKFISNTIKGIEFSQNVHPHQDFSAQSNKSKYVAQHKPKYVSKGKPVNVPQSIVHSPVASPIFNDGYTKRFKQQKPEHKQGEFYPINFNE